jgi:hypothetical protein
MLFHVAPPSSEYPGPCPDVTKRTELLVCGTKTRVAGAIGRKEDTTVQLCPPSVVFTKLFSVPLYGIYALPAKPLSESLKAIVVIP